MDPMMISYAQNSEDVVLARALANVEGGFYIDVGAAHPVYDSVTKHFYDRGWRGINIEPHPGFFKLLAEERPRDINLNVGLSDQPGQLTFYEHPTLAGSSTFVPEVASAYRAAGVKLRERTVEVTTLAAVCERHVEGEIDFLKIDVEGHEEAVLAGADFRRFRPRVLVIEVIDPETQRLLDQPWEPRLVAAHYEAALFDGVNTFYVREEDLESRRVALSAPANSLDDYKRHRHIEEIVKLNAAARSTRREIRKLTAALEEARSRAGEAELSLGAAREEAAALRAALEETRSQFVDARLSLRDVRYELSATQRALASEDGTTPGERETR
jgi:FkbM family methyltransferase